jgi:hypothetical protein
MCSALSVFAIQDDAKGSRFYKQPAAIVAAGQGSLASVAGWDTITVAFHYSSDRSYLGLWPVTRKPVLTNPERL